MNITKEQISEWTKDYCFMYVNAAVDLDSIEEFIYQCIQDLAPKDDAARIKELEDCLLSLIDFAGTCDSWESFPDKPLEDAYQCVKKGSPERKS